MGDFEWHEFFSSKCCARRFFLDVKNNLASTGIFCDLLGLHDSSIGGTGYSGFLGRILIKVGRNTLTSLTS